MKRKLAIFLYCILIAALASGCNSSKKNNDTSGSDSTASSVSDSKDNTSGASSDEKSSETSEKGPSEKESTDASTEPSTQITIDESGVSIDEDGNIIIDIDDISDWSDLDDDEDPVIDDGRSTVLEDLSYQMIYLAPDGFTTGDKLPATYCITSEDELKTFISENTKNYSLDTEHTNDDYINKTSFVNETKNMDEIYFTTNDILVVVTSYKMGTECDIGEIYEKDGVINLDLNTEEPGFTDSVAYVTFIVPSQKGTFAGKKINTRIVPLIFDEEPEEQPEET